MAKTILRTFEELYDKLAKRGGVVPPHDLAAERAVLVAMMTGGAEVAAEIIGARSLESSPFYREANTRIYLAGCELLRSGEQPDVLTIANQLRTTGDLENAGGVEYLSELSADLASPTYNVAHHCRIVLEKWTLRELIRISEEVKLRAFTGEDDTFQLLHRAESLFSSLLTLRQSRSVESLSEISVQVRRDIADFRSGKVEALGIPSGIDKLDGLIGGWKSATLNIIAARPSMGKTAFMLYCARQAAVYFNSPVLFFSLEMSAKELYVRFAASHIGCNYQSLQRGEIADSEFMQHSQTFDKVKLFIDDTPGITPLEIKTKLRRFVQREGVRIAFIDYLQLAEAGVKKDTRDLELGHITKDLKATAKELDIAIVCASQLSRKVEERASKEPQLSDLRESGNIEQDADIVLFPWQPGRYGKKKTSFGTATKFNLSGLPTDTEENPDLSTVVFTLAKQRNGPIGICEAVFEGANQRFRNISNFGAEYGIEKFR